MLRKIAENRPWMDVSDMELLSAEQPRTYVSLCRLREQGYAVKLLMGSDKLPELEHGWRYVPEICREFGIAVISRNGDDAEKIVSEDPYLNSLREGFVFIPPLEGLTHVSSTRVREEISALVTARNNIRQLVPEELGDLTRYIGE